MLRLTEAGKQRLQDLEEYVLDQVVGGRRNKGERIVDIAILTHVDDVGEWPQCPPQWGRTTWAGLCRWQIEGGYVEEV